MATGASGGHAIATNTTPEPPILPRFLPIPEDATTAKNGIMPPSASDKPPAQDSHLKKQPPILHQPSTAAMQRACLGLSANSDTNEGHKMPKKSNAQDIQYTPVLNKKARSQKERKPLPITGILLTKIASRKEMDRKPVNIKEVVSSLVKIDPNAYMLPHNRDPTRMVKLQHMLNTSVDFNSFMDISRLNWGRPSDNRTRLAMSFYIASDIIKDGLAALKTSQ